ncbi:serine/arginine repetitive matrix protein 3-like [Phyllostomus hastatus]|uniref:serine/arginine repetitive matrix protein 3-like n=1 Tax=Phyllostomus hastatus TaxID=9423 RepID=UPI001E67EF25|nr:serine/arginine repetitive matrix protein 3-like [Phyllostomus hastatus]
MRAEAGGRGRAEGRRPRRGAAVRSGAPPCRRGRIRGGSPPAEGAVAGRRGRGSRLPGPGVGRARGGSSPPASAPALGSPVRLGASERAGPPSTSLGPVVLRVLGAVALERFPREPERTEQLRDEARRPCRVETLVGSAQTPQPISGRSRRLRNARVPDAGIWNSVPM